MNEDQKCQYEFILILVAIIALVIIILAVLIILGIDGFLVNIAVGAIVFLVTKKRYQKDHKPLSF
jgi:hypothetical protein